MTLPCVVCTIPDLCRRDGECAYSQCDRLQGEVERRTVAEYKGVVGWACYLAAVVGLAVLSTERRGLAPADDEVTYSDQTAMQIVRALQPLVGGWGDAFLETDRAVTNRIGREAMSGIPAPPPAAQLRMEEA